MARHATGLQGDRFERKADARSGRAMATAASHVRKMRTAGSEPIAMAGNRAGGEHAGMVARRDPEERAGGETGPATRFSRCSGPEQEMIRRHLDRAVDWVEATISKLGRFLDGNMSRESGLKILQAYLVNFDPARLRRGGPMSTPEQRTMGRNLRHILDKLGDIHGGLQRNLLYVCLDRCPQHRMAQVEIQDESETGGLILPPGSIEMCRGWFRCDDYFSRVTTLIHEVIHSELLLLGDVYEWSSAYYSMDWSTSSTNADSYSVFIRQVYHLGRSDMGPGRSCDS